MSKARRADTISVCRPSGPVLVVTSKPVVHTTGKECAATFVAQKRNFKARASGYFYSQLKLPCFPCLFPIKRQIQCHGGMCECSDANSVDS